uniref:Uncharacterized protein n=1 Tax=Candidatus Methanogaster sp. ANME-2c ERB4 TaxID=2759911 RepID=A0A7G9YG78_9EURY|nr:hypothetical protein JMDIOONB_00024 [Methanosarcinales archaeon ANME-2c ERB4]
MFSTDQNKLKSLKNLNLPSEVALFMIVIVTTNLTDAFAQIGVHYTARILKFLCSIVHELQVGSFRSYALQTPKPHRVLLTDSCLISKLKQLRTSLHLKLH